MKKSWFFLINPFLTATNGSYSNAYQISVFHWAALNAAKDDPFFAALLATYQPVHYVFVSSYNQWSLQAGLQQGHTETIKQLFKDLNVKIKNWDVAIQNVYPDTTPAYKSLLPHKRSPFQTGTQKDRLTAIQNLIDAIDTDKDLATVKAGVTAFQTIIVEAVGNQKTALQKTGLDSDGLEAKRIAICVAQYANLGAMMQQFANTPDVIEAFFDLRNIRQDIQTVFTKELKANEVYLIARRSFKPDDVIELVNTGNTAIAFYIANKKDAAASDVIINVTAGESKNVAASELGDIANLHFLIAKNTDAAINGSFEAYLE